MSKNDLDRVRKNTSSETNEEIDQKILESLQNYTNKSHEEISSRIIELEKEWSIERWLEMNASFLAFVGLVLGYFLNQYWLLIPAFVLPFLFLHAVQGWCPPVPVMRKLKIRTRREIDWEKFSLKFIRGDFANISPATDLPGLLQKIKKVS